MEGRCNNNSSSFIEELPNIQCHQKKLTLMLGSAVPLGCILAQNLHDLKMLYSDFLWISVEFLVLLERETYIGTQEIYNSQEVLRKFLKLTRFTRPFLRITEAVNSADRGDYLTCATIANWEGRFRGASFMDSPWGWGRYFSDVTVFQMSLFL